MTHDILPSDIQLALRMRDEKQPDEVIIAALVHRGVAAPKAAQLVAELQDRKKVLSRTLLPPEFSLAKRSRTKISTGADAQTTPPPPPSEPPPPPPAAAREPSSARSGPDREASHRGTPAPPAAPGRREPRTARAPAAVSKSTRLVVTILLGLVILVAAVVVIQKSKSSPKALPAPAPVSSGNRANVTSPATPAATPDPSPGPLKGPLALEFHADGVHLGGSVLTRGNLLPTVLSLLGTPTRTNQVTQTGTMIYAYDRQGLLVYSQPGGRTNSIVLDCEGTGGANGTTSPFAGTLRIEDQVVSPDTDAQTLTAMKVLALNRRGSDGTVWGGRYGELDLVFAYLRTPQRLSLIEIDLK